MAAAVEILHEGGLDAVSMRSVAGRLGVTPPAGVRADRQQGCTSGCDRRAFPRRPRTSLVARDEPWPDYARRWAHQMRQRLTEAADSRLFLQVKRPTYLEATKPLLKCMRRDGMSKDWRGSRVPAADVGDRGLRRHGSPTVGRTVSTPEPTGRQ